MNTPPTRWFRMPQSWPLIAAALKTRAANGNPQTIEIVGVATGQEAYSLAMILEHLEIPGHIHATDIDPELVDRAKAAVYTDEHVREAMTAGGAGARRGLELLRQPRSRPLDRDSCSPRPCHVRCRRRGLFSAQVLRHGSRAERVDVHRCSRSRPPTRRTPVGNPAGRHPRYRRVRLHNCRQPS